MRKEIKTDVKINDKIIIVYELNIAQIKAILEKKEDVEITFKSVFDQHLSDFTNLTPNDLKPEYYEKIYPSQIRHIWQKIKEVNADFLWALEQTGILSLFQVQRILIGQKLFEKIKDRLQENR